MDFRIEKVENESRLNVCLKIREKVFIEEKHVPREIENDEFDRLRDDCEHFLIYYNGKPVGTVRFRFTDSGIVKLQRFCFLEDCRKLGLGSKVLEYAEKRYKSLGKSKIVIEAKFSASQFYEKCSYKAVSEIFYEVGVEHIRMEKEL